MRWGLRQKTPTRDHCQALAATGARARSAGKVFPFPESYPRDGGKSLEGENRGRRDAVSVNCSSAGSAAQKHASVKHSGRDVCAVSAEAKRSQWPKSTFRDSWRMLREAPGLSKVTIALGGQTRIPSLRRCSDVASF